MRYPASTLSVQKDRYYVVVTIPEKLRDHFNGQKQLKRSTGTSDKQLALQIQHEKTTELYLKFDEAIRSTNPINKTFEKLLDTLGYNGAEMLTGDDLSNPLVIDDILFQFRAEINRKMFGGDPFNEADARNMHIAQLEIEPTINKIEKYRDHRITQIGKQFEKGFSSAASEYIASKEWGREKTKVAAQKAVNVFIDRMGDLSVSEFTKKIGYDYAEILSKENLANKTIKNKIGNVSKVLNYCEKKGWITTNPFHGLDLAEYGKPSERYRPFTTEQLFDLFKQDMPTDVRLLFSILISTGMRLDEVATLQFSDIKTENKISFIDLTPDEKVIKNIGSARKVPLTPELKKIIGDGSGKLFPRFRIDSDGKAQGSASKASMPYIRKVAIDPKIVIHSLRGTFKDMLRDSGVSKEINDFITGHGSGDVGGEYGSGPSLKARYVALCSVEQPWLK